MVVLRVVNQLAEEAVLYPQNQPGILHKLLIPLCLTHLIDQVAAVNVGAIDFSVHPDNRHLQGLVFQNIVVDLLHPQKRQLIFHKLHPVLRVIGLSQRIDQIAVIVVF